MIIERTTCICLVLGPLTALYELFLKCLTNKAVGTIWRALYKLPQRNTRSWYSSSPIVSRDSIGPWTWACFQMGGVHLTLADVTKYLLQLTVLCRSVIDVLSNFYWHFCVVTLQHSSFCNKSEFFPFILYVYQNQDRYLTWKYILKFARDYAIAFCYHNKQIQGTRKETTTCTFWYTSQAPSVLLKEKKTQIHDHAFIYSTNQIWILK